ncbi:hypothetical protein [Roseicella aerolata]|uniref:AsmA-like C-terminal domain-containing protein n=1 Tax=Roseicella aerolata TaxID=2883479 RepID=A0A9X1L734_9PROT|nr:hypothetical protein [Roseicella aerolata]MCB4821501.1 hypothetical protein [Roseicella aerolata]
MRWLWGAALAIGLTGGIALAQQKPPPLDPPRPAAPGGPSDAAPGFDKFGEPIPPARPPSSAAPGAQPPGAAPPPLAAAPADALPALARFRALLGSNTTLAYRAAEPIDPATGSVRLLGARLTREGARAEIEELTLDGLAEDRIGAASAREVVLTGSDGLVTRIARLELRGLAAPGGGAPDALALDSLRLESVVGLGDPQMAIGEATLEEYGQGRPGRLTITGLDLLSPQAGLLDRLRVGRITLRGLDLAAAVAAMAAQEAPPRAAGGYALEVEEVAATLADQPVASLGALRIQGDPPAGGIEAGRVALRELRLEPFPGLAEWLRRFGYAALSADLTAESRYDRAAGRLEIGLLSLAGREMGVLGLSITLDGVTPEAAEGAEWEQLALVGFALRYLDQSLYGRAVRDQAQRLRLPEARVREQWASQAAAALSAGPGGGSARGPAGALAPVLGAVQRFLRGEAREVEITARPPRPVPLGDVPAALMGGPAETQRVLGLGGTAR